MHIIIKLLTIKQVSVIVDPSLGADDGCLESWGALADSIALVSSFLLCSRIVGAARLLGLFAANSSFRFLPFALFESSRSCLFPGLVCCKAGGRGLDVSF